MPKAIFSKKYFRNKDSVSADAQKIVSRAFKKNISDLNYLRLVNVDQRQASWKIRDVEDVENMIKGRGD